MAAMREAGHRRAPGSATLLRGLLLLLLPALLAACAAQPAYRSAQDYAQSSSRNYPPPGPPEDPWGPYIREATNRFGVPQQWVRAVMHQESGGHAFQNGRPIVSSAGAMGLMQVMPATYEDLRAQFDLGEDPYDPHNSILAGTAYIRQMYDKYGAPGFLAAYNAGPQRLDDYLAGASSLPNETVNYLAAITPHLGRERPMSGPLAAYADASQPVADRPAALPGIGRAGPVRLASARTRGRGGCVPDPDAAYDAPCGTPARPPQPEVLPVQVAAVMPTGPGCVRDPDAAFDSPCVPVAPTLAMARPVSSVWQPPAAPAPGDASLAYRQSARAPASYAAPSPREAAYASASSPSRPAELPFRMAEPAQRRSATAPAAADAAGSPSLGMRLAALAIPSAQAEPVAHHGSPGPAEGAWAVQVGAFANAGEARQTAEAARALAASLGGARPVIGTTTPFGGSVLYRARLAGLSLQQAQEGCSQLQRQHRQCMTVAPGA